VGSVGGGRGFVRGCGCAHGYDRGRGHARDRGCVAPCWRGAIVLVRSFADGCMQASGLTIEVALPFVAE
jgi:hypothetical protein